MSHFGKIRFEIHVIKGCIELIEIKIIIGQNLLVETKGPKFIEKPVSSNVNLTFWPTKRKHDLVIILCNSMHFV
jgi:hypothetical protein